MWRPCSGKAATEIVLTSAWGTGPLASTPDGLNPVLKAARTTAATSRHPAPFFRNMEKSVFLEPEPTANFLAVAGLTLKFQEVEFDASGRKTQGPAQNSGSLSPRSVWR
jgi:hypothetical protein